MLLVKGYHAFEEIFESDVNTERNRFQNRIGKLIRLEVDAELCCFEQVTIEELEV